MDTRGRCPGSCVKQESVTDEGQKRSKNMRAIRSKDTKPELIVRRAIHAAGYRYRLHVKDLPGKPDLVFPRFHAVVEVRGCFWHGHTCSDGHVPHTNTSYWTPKLQGNKDRDERNVRALKALGYRVKVIWECELKSPSGANKVVERLARWLSNANVK